jgi:hypothetical protein
MPENFELLSMGVDSITIQKNPNYSGTDLTFFEGRISWQDLLELKAYYQGNKSHKNAWKLTLELSLEKSIALPCFGEIAASVILIDKRLLKDLDPKIPIEEQSDYIFSVAFANIYSHIKSMLRLISGGMGVGILELPMLQFYNPEKTDRAKPKAKPKAEPKIKCKPGRKPKKEKKTNAKA